MSFLIFHCSIDSSAALLLFSLTATTTHTNAGQTTPNSTTHNN
jgi:hypothetical protein